MSSRSPAACGRRRWPTRSPRSATRRTRRARRWPAASPAAGCARSGMGDAPAPASEGTRGRCPGPDAAGARVAQVPVPRPGSPRGDASAGVAAPTRSRPVRGPARALARDCPGLLPVARGPAQRGLGPALLSRVGRHGVVEVLAERLEVRVARLAAPLGGDDLAAPLADALDRPGPAERTRGEAHGVQ